MNECVRSQAGMLLLQVRRSFVMCHCRERGANAKANRGGFPACYSLVACPGYLGCKKGSGVNGTVTTTGGGKGGEVKWGGEGGSMGGGMRAELERKDKKSCQPPTITNIIQDRKQSDARPVLQHPIDPQARRHLQRRHRRRAIGQGGGSRRRSARRRRRLRRCRDRDHLCAGRAGALDERARRRRRDGALPCARGPL